MLVGVLLVLELRRVNADHDQFVGVLLFQLRQVGHDVDAVDAAERPEVEQDDLALEVFLERERAAGVEPGDAAIEFRSRDLLLVLVVSVVFFILWVEAVGGDWCELAQLVDARRPLIGRMGSLGVHLLAIRESRISQDRQAANEPQRDRQRPAKLSSA